MEDKKGLPSGATVELIGTGSIHVQVREYQVLATGLAECGSHIAWLLDEVIQLNRRLEEAHALRHAAVNYLKANAVHLEEGGYSAVTLAAVEKAEQALKERL